MAPAKMRTETNKRLEEIGGLEELYPLLAAQNFTAGWHKKRPSLWREPKTDFRPTLWRYADAYAALTRAGEWIGTDLAERRNLMLFNPVGDNDYASLNTLVAAYQMIKPGEHARTHRHSPRALRLVLEADAGLFTVVDGAKLPMVQGDVLLTPGGCWHSHFHDGKSESYWIDILDVPLVHLLQPMFFEEYPGGTQPVTDAPQTSPFWFPYSAVVAGLASAPPDINGIKRHVLDSEPFIHSMQLTWMEFPAEARTGVIRSTASRFIIGFEGCGYVRIGESRFNWERGDILAIPAWTPYEIFAETNARIFEASDEPVLRKLGLHFGAGGLLAKK